MQNVLDRVWVGGSWTGNTAGCMFALVRNTVNCAFAS